MKVDTDTERLTLIPETDEDMTLLSLLFDGGLIYTLETPITIFITYDAGKNGNEPGVVIAKR